ncbi:MAG: HAMP domain-containing histidine kinase [Okeania sp. SIO3C4]|nr:HAMP domain-containing histidine kinase [Okeania sp. SIO3C4]
MLRNITLNNIDEELARYKEVTQAEFEQLLSFPERFVYFDVLINIQHGSISKQDTYSDTTLVIKNEPGHFRKLKFGHQYDNHNYQVEIYKSLRQADELTIQLLFVLCSLIIFFMLSFYFLNRFVAMRSLEDFFDIISKIRHFQVDKKENLELPQTDVDEFEQLNTVLGQKTDQVRVDYFNLKEFTENASHEIQTPLAIISTKLEQMFQDSSLNERQLMTLATIQEAVNRLSKLNKGLLLLTKIENNQFGETQPIKIEEIVQQQLDNLDEFIENRKINVETSLKNQIEVELNPYLTELLIFNLLKNAIRHNIDEGRLIISLNENTLSIQNQGADVALDVERIFERFSKGSHSKSMGLGLAIVKKVCDVYGIHLDYDFGDGFHKMFLSFPKRIKEF